MRTLNSAKNLISGLSITLIMTFMGFITRKVFVDSVGVEYLGLNGLLQNILGVMSLLEGGFATSVVYNLYKPLAQDDRTKILALLQLYRKVYRYIALGVFLCSLLIFPFLDLFIKEAGSLSNVSVIYFIFLFNSLLQYFTAYKWAVINASQQNYKLTLINLTYQVGLSLTKLMVLYYTQNYVLYLVLESLFGVGLNWAVVRKANQLFPYIVTKKVYKVEPAVKKNIITNMKALFLHSVGGYFMHATDNIIISSFVGIGVVGLYSNYTLLIGVVGGMMMQILNSFSESVGNLIAVEAQEKIYDVFRTVFFVNFLVVSVSVIVLYNTLQPFIEWWLGAEYRLSQFTVCLILFNFYINNMRKSAFTFKVKSGIFMQDRFTPFLQGMINFVLSLILVQYWGITGVLLATGLSILAIGFWQFPRLVYKHTFNRPLRTYFKYYIYYSLTGMAALGLSVLFCNYNRTEGMFAYTVINGLLSLSAVAIVYWLMFNRCYPYRQLKGYVLGLLHW